MATIDYLQTTDGDTLYPITLTSSIYGSTGVRLDAILNRKRNIRQAVVSRPTDASGGGWYIFCNTAIEVKAADRLITFLVQDPFASGDPKYGILTAHVRSKDGDGTGPWVKFYWQYASTNIDPNDFRLCYTEDSNILCVQLWCRITAAYRTYTFQVLSEGHRTGFDEGYWLLQNRSGIGEANYYSAWDSIPSTLNVIKNTAAKANTVDKLATARTIALTGAVTGSVSFDGSANISITTAVNHTHNYLPLSGGTLTGPVKNSYVSSSWISGARGNALVASTASGGSYVSLLRYPSTGGVFQLSGYQNKLYVTFMNNTNLNNGTNSVTKSGYIFDENGNASFEGTVYAGAFSGNASSATILQTARTINGTSFNGSANITTSKWGTARTITIGNKGKSVDGSGNVAWSLSEILKHGTGIFSASTDWNTITQDGWHIVAIEATDYNTSNCVNAPKNMYTYGSLFCLNLGEIAIQIYIPHIFNYKKALAYASSKSGSYDGGMYLFAGIAYRGKWVNRSSYAAWEYLLSAY